MNIVFYVAHVDDEILGGGGTIARMIEAGHRVDVVYATDGQKYHPDYNYNNISAAFESLSHLGVPEKNVHFLGFPMMELQSQKLIDMNIAFDELGLNPDVIITVDKNDVNQDHWAVYNSASIVGRSIEKPVGLLAMETLSSSEWGEEPTNPDFYVDISSTIEQKIEAMEQVEHELEEWPHPRSRRGIKIKSQQRGMEVGYDYAEAFRTIRWFAKFEALV